MKRELDVKFVGVNGSLFSFPFFFQVISLRRRFKMKIIMSTMVGLLAVLAKNDQMMQSVLFISLILILYVL